MSRTTDRSTQRKPARGPLPTVQPRLAVGPVNDRLEREADRVAEHVVASSGSVAFGPPPVLSGVTAQRVPAPMPVGPELLDDEFAAPEARVQRAARAAGPETPSKPPSGLDEVEDPQQLAGVGMSMQRAPDRSIDVGPHGGTAPARVESAIEAMRRAPAPGLDAGTRDAMESRMGTDLGGVRLHADRNAGDAARSLGARAFTVGQDVFFAPGQLDTDTTGGRRLLAHELAHTVQQGGGTAGAQRIQRAADDKSTISPDPESDVVTRLEGPNWAIDLTPTADAKGTVTVAKLELPRLAGALKGTRGGENEPAAAESRQLPVAGQPFRLGPVPPRPEGVAAEVWRRNVREKYSPGLAKKLGAQLAAQPDAHHLTSEDSSSKGERVYVLRRAKGKASDSARLLVGTVVELAEHDGIVRPMLNANGNNASFDADHILELQIGGGDTFDNMWLLESSKNRSFGSTIGTRIRASIDQAISGATSELGRQKKQAMRDKQPIPKPATPLPSTEVAVRRQWLLEFRSVEVGKGFRKTEQFWTRDQIREGKQLPHFKAMNEEELVERGFNRGDRATPPMINVFPHADGGLAVPFKINEDGSMRLPKFFFRGLTVLEVLEKPNFEAKGGVITKLNLEYEKKDKNTGKVLVVEIDNIAVQHDPRLGFGGYVTGLQKAIKAKFQPLSPIEFANVDISSDGELVADGEIAVTKALFPNLRVPIHLRGSDVFVSFPVPQANLSFGPVSVTEAAIDLGVGDGGFFMQGSAGITIDRVGSGMLIARGQGDDVILSGDFALDLDFLDPAQVAVRYSLAKDQLHAKATLGVKKGSLPGVKSGQVDITLTRGQLGLVGSLELGGLLAGSTITIGYTPETGLVIEGRDLPVPVEKLPGVSEAKVTVIARRSPETGAWTVSGGGSAKLDKAGATGSLDILFDGEAIFFKGRAKVEKGPASGWLEVIATNRELDEEGRPIESGPVGALKIWGKGEATIRFGKILQGTAGIEYTPEGHVVLRGEIGLADTFKLFDHQPYSYTILELAPPDFWIWGVKLGPVGFGIFAFVDAKVTFDALVGPGELRDTKVRAEIDLDKPEDATVEGGAVFHVPAYAGFTIDVGGGVKAQAAVAFVKGRIGLKGSLGLSAVGELATEIHWNRTEGLSAAVTASVNVSPKFSLGVNASVTAGVDLWLKTFKKTWGPWSKPLGEFGPDVNLAVSFPVKWSEKNGLEMSLKDIDVKKPDLSAVGLMKDAFGALV